MKTFGENRRLASLAAMIHDRLTAPSQPLPCGELPEHAWRQAQKSLRRLRRAQQRRWLRVEADSQAELRFSIERLRDELQRLLPRLQPPDTRPSASAHDIYRDLLVLYDEFDDVAWSRKDSSLSVTTDPITLEGTYLGPFRIELDIREFHDQPIYSVIAVDPQPSGRDSEVTHPHVQGEQLCEGEGTLPVRAALREGRLLDFFLIVSNLLHTYNSASPFVPLEEWAGVRCRECDYTMDEEESRHCERCDVALCSECVRYCNECSDSACSRCSHVCGACDEDLCAGCAKECRDCLASFCADCLQDDERCHRCHEEYEEASESDGSDSALQSV